MSQGMPSMIALLGLLAVAGYQNKDKIAAYLGGAGQKDGEPTEPGATKAGGGGILDGLGGSPNADSVVSGGLGELVSRLKKAGQGAIADSWIKDGPNQTIAVDDLERSLGQDTIKALMQRTGLSQDQLLLRLSSTLPAAVDKYTPDARLPELAPNA